METQKILSIIIPTYNMERYLSKCINSLLIPSLNLLDIIIVNDGSKDKSSEIAHSYSKKYPESIRIIDKKNGNYGSCINKALTLVKGKYIKILDADDSFDTQNLEMFINRIKNINVDCILTDYLLTNEFDIPMRKMSFKKLEPYHTYTLQEISNYISIRICMHAVTYNSSLFKKNDYYQSEGISYTDQEWIFAPIAWSKTFLYIPLIVYKYLIGREGQTVDIKITERNKSHNYMILERMCIDAKDYISDEQAKNFILQRLSYLIKSQIFKDLSKVQNRNLLKEFLILQEDNLKEIGLDINKVTRIASFYYPIKKWRKDKFSDLFIIPYTINRLHYFGGIILHKLINR